ncbi:MAG: 16S rRNA methyltransferase [Thermoplasmatota archaeon]
MLTLILGEAELEPVPPAIVDHPNVRATRAARGKRRNQPVLLDGSVHHEALKQIPEGERRGRPDLTHFFLVLALDSLANQRDALRIVIHTRNDERITVAPTTRIMRNYPRFVGLMEQLFQFRRVPANPVLFEIEEKWSLERVIAEHRTGPVIAFTPAGRRIGFRSYVEEKAKAGDFTCLLGGFPKGDWHANVGQIADDVVSVADAGLSVWSVETALVAFYEDAIGLYSAT